MFREETLSENSFVTTSWPKNIYISFVAAFEWNGGQVEQKVYKVPHKVTKST